MPMHSLLFTDVSALNNNNQSFINYSNQTFGVSLIQTYISLFNVLLGTHFLN